MRVKDSRRASICRHDFGADGRLAGIDGCGGVPEAVCVLVGVEGVGHPLVDDAVTVVVGAVAQLSGAGVDQRVVVVAVLAGVVAVVRVDRKVEFMTRDKISVAL